ncbi:CUB and sushi domain-containing protein 3 [Mactra antiquata]
MRIFIFVLLAQLPLVIKGHFEIRTEDIQLTYNITFVGQCESDTNRIQYYSYVSVPFCVIECALRSHCKGLNYYPRMKACELFTELGNVSTEIGCIRIRVEDVIVHKSPCEQVCDEWKACDSRNNTCVVKECIDFPSVANGGVLGNMREVHDHAKIKCNVGYYTKVKNGLSSCTENGTWQSSTGCLKDCGRLPIPPGVTIDANTGTLEGDEQIYSCPSGFVDVETSLRRVCQENGIWNGTIPNCVQEVCSYQSCYAVYMDENISAYDLSSIYVTSFDDCAQHCVLTAPDHKSIVYCTTVAPYGFTCFCKSVATSEGQYTRHSYVGCHYYHVV